MRPIREFRAITAVTFHSPQGGDAGDADKPKEREERPISFQMCVSV
jgi:hypothetical protein